MNGKTAPDRFGHAARSLDLAGVLDLIAGHCQGEAARERIRGLRPGADKRSISESLTEIAEYRSLIDGSGSLPVADVAHRDTLGALVESHGVPDAALLLRIAAAERTAAEIFDALRDADRYPRLRSITDALDVDRELVDAIERAVDRDGTLKDSASPELKRIRRSIVSSKTSLRRKSESLAGDFGDGTLSTMLGDRHVLVVPRGRVARRNGLVHSTSQTGESLYFEPSPLVEANNALETLHADESAEVARILAALGEMVHARARTLFSNIELLVRLEAVGAKALFARAHRCTTPEDSRNGRIRLIRARHPLLEKVLAASSEDQALVPLDVTLEPAARLMVITGPNAGGKTVALKTLGICALMFQCGLQVPCEEGSELPIFANVFVDIGDEQSIEDSLSTFTSHLRYLDAMTRFADARSLCLVDEVGGGTDPDEGAALAISSLETLIESGAAVVATTHYGRIKAFALGRDGVTNASMAFEQGRPLYRLLQGVAGRSRGLETARLTGFNTEVVERAESYLGEDAFRLESVLAELEQRILDLDHERRELARARDEADAARRDYEARSAEFRMTKKEANRRALREANDILVRTRAEMERVVQSIRERNADKEAIRTGRERIATMLDDVRRALGDSESESKQPGESVSVGDTVSLNESGTPRGTVIGLENETATVEIAGKRIKLPVKKLFAATSGTDPAPPAVTHDASFEPLASTTLDLRGHEREEAVAELIRFIDRAVLAGVEEVQVIHGIGGGVLSRAVRDYLNDDVRVASTRSGDQAEGGAGVTFARFV